MSIYVTPRRLNCIKYEAQTSDRIFLENRHWLPKEQEALGHHLQAENDADMWKFVTHLELYEALKNGAAKITVNYHTKEQTRLRSVVGDTHLHEMKPNGVKLARHKEVLIETVEEATRARGGKPLSNVALRDLLVAKTKAINTLLFEEAQSSNYSNKSISVDLFQAPTPKTYKAYWNEYLACDRDVRSLVPRHHGPGPRKQPDATPENVAIWQRHAYRYLSRRKPSMKKLREECEAEIFQINDTRKNEGRTDFLVKPKRKRFENIIRRIDAYEVMAAREGYPKARALFRAQMTGFDIVRPGERVEFDSYLLELQTWLETAGIWRLLKEETKKELERQRIWVIMARDAATGYILGVRAMLTENSEGVIDTLDMALSDKTHISRLVGAETDWLGGIVFDAGYADNGAPYISKNTHEAFRAAGVNLTHPPAGQPWHRGFIESILALVSEHLLSCFDGRTFSDVGAKGDYPAEEMATLTSDEAIALLIRSILDYFHHRVKASTGETPHNAWVKYLEDMGVRNFDIDPHKRRHVFGVTLAAKIQADGMYVWGMRYQSAQLQLWRQKLGQKKFLVRFHKDDIRWISVKTPDGWINVENRIRLKEAVSANEWIFAAKDAENNALSAQEPYLPRMFRALNNLRTTGDAAALRAAISPHRMTSADLIARHNELFEGLEMSAADGDDTQVADVEVPYDPLHHGGIAAKRLEGPLSTAKAKLQAIDEDPLDEDDLLLEDDKPNNENNDGDDDDDDQYGNDDDDGDDQFGGNEETNGE